jgi:hypothetical protein
VEDIEEWPGRTRVIIQHFAFNQVDSSLI